MHALAQLVEQEAGELLLVFVRQRDELARASQLIQHLPKQEHVQCMNDRADRVGLLPVSREEPDEQRHHQASQGSGGDHPPRTASLS